MLSVKPDFVAGMGHVQRLGSVGPLNLLDIEAGTPDESPPRAGSWGQLFTMDPEVGSLSCLTIVLNWVFGL